MLDGIMFVHPKDLQDRLIKIPGQDIITNLPYVSDYCPCFDRHGIESTRHNNTVHQIFILDPDTDSTA